MQKTTIPTQLQYIRNFLGYTIRFHGIDPASLSLKLYQDGRIYAAYVGWLMARGGGRNHLVKHVSLARKVNYFLMKHAITALEKQHSDNVDSWLEALSRQLQASMAKPQCAYVPDWSEVAMWAEGLAEEVKAEVKRELEETGSISVELARKNHDALLVCLVAGTSSPPLRLWIIKTLAPPEFSLEHGCQDPDCRQRDRCLGNTVQIVLFKSQAGENDVALACKVGRFQTTIWATTCLIGLASLITFATPCFVLQRRGA